MTKLEEKLIELGYKKDDFPYKKIYIKRFKDFEFWLYIEDNRIIKKALFHEYYSEYSGFEFDCIEKVVDEIKNDLEVLKSVED